MLRFNEKYRLSKKNTIIAQLNENKAKKKTL